MSSTEEAVRNTWNIYTLIKNRRTIQSELITLRDADGYTILHWAAIDGNLPLIETLQDQGADIAVASHNGTTALHIAAYHGHQQMVLYLLSCLRQKKITVNPTDQEQCTPLYFAAIREYDDIKSDFIKNGADQSFILHIAAQHNTVHKMIKAFAKEIIDSYKDYPNDKQQTPLHIAVLYGHIEAIQALSEIAVEMNKCDDDGYTPLDIAQEKQLQQGDLERKKSYQNIIAFLLENKARNGKGLINTISLYAYRHFREWRDLGYVFAFWIALCLFKMKLIYLIYVDNPDAVLIAENAIALPRNLTQEDFASAIDSTSQMKCALQFNAEDITLLACYDSQQEFLTHIFSKEAEIKTTTSESITATSVETAVSPNISPNTAINERELTGDIYDLNTCKPVEYFESKNLPCRGDKCKRVEYFGRKSLHCEGDKTVLFTSKIQKSDPLNASNILNFLNPILIMGIFGVLVIRSFYEQYTAVPASTDKKPDLIIDNYDDIQDFFEKYTDDKGKNEARSDSDEFSDFIVDNVENEAVQGFFQKAEQKLKQIEQLIPETKDDVYSSKIISFFFQPRNSLVKNSIISIRESLKDLKGKKRILKSDLHYIALDIYDLKIGIESKSDIFVPAQDRILPPMI